jgi:aspartate aminotransferase-like enzyme
MIELGIDCLLTGSQKGFGIPPGLAFIALSDRAWNSLSARPKFYFDLKKERDGQAKGETAWTPATTLVESLLVSLEMLAKIGPKACDAHHKRFANACHKAASAMGLKLFSKAHHSQALTAIELPANIDGSKLLKYCRTRFGTVFAGGQDHLKGKIIRLAHLGIVDELDLIGGIAALEMGLQKLGHTSKLGVGVSAAMEALNTHE